VYTDKVNTSDNWGAKAKITYSNPFGGIHKELLWDWLTGVLK
jgi:hypothetical protein